MNPILRFELIPSQLHGYYLGISEGINGAIAAFYPRALDNICRILNDDIYVVISCTRDCMIHPASLYDVASIKDLAKNALAHSKFLEEQADILDAGAYSYTRERKTLVKL
jgi:hypothetical protein